jgi:SAM-dependent methyltransferase
MDSLLYHAHHKLYTEDLAFWQALAVQQAGLVLELGCGTGRIYQPLHQAGCSIFGLDLSQEMLSLLKSEQKDANIFQADLVQFNLDQKFNLIFLACNTWSIFSREERMQALKTIDRHLAPGGMFSISMPNPEILLDLEECDSVEQETTLVHPTTGNPVEVSSEWSIETEDSGQRLVTFIWHYDHLTPNGGLERVTHATRHWTAPAQTFIEEFENQGWQVKAFGDFKKNPLALSSPYLILLGEKPNR